MDIVVSMPPKYWWSLGSSSRLSSSTSGSRFGVSP